MKAWAKWWLIHWPEAALKTVFCVCLCTCPYYYVLIGAVDAWIQNYRRQFTPLFCSSHLLNGRNWNTLTNTYWYHSLDSTYVLVNLPDCLVSCWNWVSLHAGFACDCSLISAPTLLTSLPHSNRIVDLKILSACLSMWNIDIHKRMIKEV
jgi:hypothetical protein